MSGSNIYSLKELIALECPFCDGELTLMRVDTCTRGDGLSWLLVEATCTNRSGCPAMSESGCISIHLYGDGRLHAYYY